MKLVKLITNDDSEKTADNNWHYAMKAAGAEMTLCTGEFFGTGESSATYKTKEVKRGITCPNCIAIIKEIKSIKL